MMFHGTTIERLKSINSKGLLKGTFVTPDYSVAEHFARSRSAWNGQRPVILVVNGQTDKVRCDRSGRLEARLLENCEALVDRGE